MIMSLIVAMTQNRVIGQHNAIPWHLPNDLKFFKRITMGKPIIMGRNTYESIGKPLPGRENIVITRNPDYHVDGVHIVASVQEAIELCGQLTAPDHEAEIMVIGGQQIFEQTLPLADRIYLTELHTTMPGDVFFPRVPNDQFQEIGRENFPATPENPFTYSFLILERVTFE
ncbi:MAG: dihydrofolate reductase [Pseudomonadota bacterium]